ncbi:MAG: oxygen-independent coproporphyrinogen III oxidase-like protein, partial [Gammaproteobacteria bacterium HGW-Gammaproteobacteria-7]
FALSQFEARTGLGRDAIAGPVGQAIVNGWLAAEGDHVRPTKSGLRFNNDLIQLFL